MMKLHFRAMHLIEREHSTCLTSFMLHYDLDQSISKTVLVYKAEKPVISNLKKYKLNFKTYILRRHIFAFQQHLPVGLTEFLMELRLIFLRAVKLCKFNT